MRKTHLPILTAAELIAAGEALYGPNWRAELVRTLGLRDDRVIRAVEAGRMEAPADWRASLIEIAQETAVRAMDTAGALLWCDREEQEPQAAFTPPRMV